MKNAFARSFFERVSVYEELLNEMKKYHGDLEILPELELAVQELSTHKFS